MDARQLADAMRVRYHVKLGVTGPRQFRAVTHYWITSEHIRTAIEGIREVLAGAP